MCQISSTEFKNHYGKYVKIAQKEEIQVYKQGKLLFSIVPPKETRLEMMRSLFGVLPKDASLGTDPDERG